jgi:6-pyruvoyltetrahydropterin/6-carboxytetrahydropterin synthase
MYEVGAATSFPAMHVMHGMEGPEGELHEHHYRLEVVVERGELDASGMVCDLDRVTDALANIADRLRGRDLDVILPPGTESVTVEVFAAWAHQELARSLGPSQAGSLAVRVWESPDAFGGYRSSP